MKPLREREKFVPYAQYQCEIIELEFDYSQLRTAIQNKRIQKYYQQYKCLVAITTFMLFHLCGDFMELKEKNEIQIANKYY